MDASELVQRDIVNAKKMGHEVTVSDDQALILTYQAVLDFAVTLRAEIARRGLWPG